MKYRVYPHWFGQLQFVADWPFLLLDLEGSQFHSVQPPAGLVRFDVSSDEVDLIPAPTSEDTVQRRPIAIATTRQVLAMFEVFDVVQRSQQIPEGLLHEVWRPSSTARRFDAHFLVQLVDQAFPRST